MGMKKGNPGYLDSQKKRVLFKVILEFGIVIALLVLGIVQTKSRLNLLTLVAILGCLPASKALVELIMLIPHHSMDSKNADEVVAASGNLTCVFDLVFTTEHQIMPVDCVVISGRTICGYAPNEKTNPDVAAKHLKQMLSQNQFGHVTVKLFRDYKAFLSRVEGMESIADIEKPDTRKSEEAMKRVIQNISL